MLDTCEVSRVVLFDGECNLCNHTVQFILRHDPARRFHFASLQSPIARQMLQQAGEKPEDLPDSIVLLEGNRVFTRSTAALRIARQLNGPWPLLSVFLLVPTVLRDVVYDLIARNRYRLFGRRESCWLPTPELKERFLSE